MTVAPEGDALTRISIFLNVFDVHVNRSPVEGIIRDVQYRKGRFLVASKEAASVENEQTVITMETPDGVRVVFKQIAGLIARRVVFRKSAGERLSAGERIGMMKFGSRMDILLGREWRILVRPGERVIGGSTIIAERVQPTI
jgi:phosphatidylserine decarboxylase